MAKLRFKIVESNVGKQAKVTVTMTNDIAETTIDALKNLFELEMISAEHTVASKTTKVKFRSGNFERIKLVRQGLVKMYFDAQKLGPVEN